MKSDGCDGDLRGKKEVRATACPGSPFLQILGIEAVCDRVSQGRAIGLRQIDQLRRRHLFCCDGRNSEAKTAAHIST